MTVHRFGDSLSYGNDPNDESFWIAFYRQAFPLFKCAVNHNEDRAKQAEGIDRTVHLTNGNVLKIDEKKRTTDRQDIAIEYAHEPRRKGVPRRPGWILKPSNLNYIAYAFMPSRRVYLLDFPILQRTWHKHKKKWHELATAKREGFALVPAENKDYTTWSIAIPIKRLFADMGDASEVIVDLPREADWRVVEDDLFQFPQNEKGEFVLFNLDEPEEDEGNVFDD